MIIWYGIGLDLLALTVGLVLCTLGYRWARQDGYQAGLLEGHADGAQQELDHRQQQRHEARHARTRPRREPVSTPLVQAIADAPAIVDAFSADSQDQPPWYIDLGQLPGPGRPQPGRDSGPGTDTFPRFSAALPSGAAIAMSLETLGVRPRLGLPATTGEMAAVTDQYIADMAAEEDAYREAIYPGNLVS